jgi:hypothetical protein
VQGELDRVSQTLTGRIRELAERYATPLPQLTDEVADAGRPRGRNTSSGWGQNMTRRACFMEVSQSRPGLQAD